MPVYDPETEQKPLGGADDGKGESTPAESAKSDQIATGEQDLASREKNATTDGGSETQQNPKERGLYNRSEKKKSRFARMSGRKKAGIAFGIGATGGTIIFAAVPILAPLKLLHFGSLLRQTHFFNMEEFGDDRSARAIIYRRIFGASAQATRLGVVSSRFAGRQEARLAEKSGLRPVYHDDTGIVHGFQVEDEGKAARHLKEFENTEGVEIRNSSGNERLTLGKDGNPLGNGRLVLLRGPPDGSSNQVAKFRRKTLKAVTNATDLSRISSFVSSRMLIKLGGVNFGPIDNTKRGAGQKFADYFREKQDQHRNRTKTGVTNTATRAIDTDNPVDADGEPIRDPDIENAKTAANSEINAAKSGNEPTREIQGRLKGFLRTGAAATAVVGVFCAVRALGDQAEELKMTANYVIPMRMGFERMAIASQLKSFNDLTSDEIRYHYESMGGNYTGSAPVDGAMGQQITGKDIDEGSIPGNDELPLFFQAINDIWFLGTACSVQDGVGRILNAVTFGALDAGTELAVRGVDGFLGGTFGFTTGELIDSSVQWIAGEGGCSIALQGPDRSICEFYGGLYASNAQYAASGGAELSPQAIAQLENRKNELIKEDLKTASLFERFLSPTNPKSLASYAIHQTPSNRHQTVNNFAQLFNPSQLIASTVNNISTLASPKSYAATNTYEYKVPRVGFSIAEQESELIADPFENAAYVEDASNNNAKFNTLNERFGHCFPTELSLIGENDIKVEVDSFNSEPVTQFSQDPSCKKENMSSLERNEYLRFRAYMFDSVTAKSINCYEGDTASCDEVGFNSPIAHPSSGNTSTTAELNEFNGPVVPCEGQPRTVQRGPFDSANWDDIIPTGTIMNDDHPLDVYVRAACLEQNVKTVVIAASIHGSENGGQLVGHELLFNADLPPDVQVVVIPEICACAGSGNRSDSTVDLNRNSDYGWASLRNEQEFSSGRTYFKGDAPESEPEIKALNDFLRSLGPVNLFLAYHDNLNYVAPVGTTSHSVAETFASLTEMHGQCNSNPSSVNCPIKTVSQRGSIDAWFNQETGSPTLLVEWFNNPSDDQVRDHAEAIRATVERL